MCERICGGNCKKCLELTAHVISYFEIITITIKLMRFIFTFTLTSLVIKPLEGRILYTGCSECKVKGCYMCGLCWLGATVSWGSPNWSRHVQGTERLHNLSLILLLLGKKIAKTCYRFVQQVWSNAQDSRLQVNTRALAIEQQIMCRMKVLVEHEVLISHISGNAGPFYLWWHHHDFINGKKCIAANGETTQRVH